MPVQITTVPVGPIDTNCYIVLDKTLGQAFLIDPGPECEPILDHLAGVHLSHILLTHAHFDHMGGVGRLVQETDAKVWVHTNEADWLSSPVRNLSALAGISEPITAPPADRILQGGEVDQLLGKELRVYHTPGHTPGHVVYVFNDVVFVGDLIFQASVGRTDFPGGDHTQLLTSIAQVILPLPDHTRLSPGHGSSTTVGEERRHNPYLIGIR